MNFDLYYKPGNERNNGFIINGSNTKVSKKLYYEYCN